VTDRPQLFRRKGSDIKQRKYGAVVMVMAALAPTMYASQLR
jgi:hypothetical protein